MRRWLCLLVCAGCEFEHGAIPGDAQPDVPDMTGCASVAQLSISFCLAEPATGTVNVTADTNIDTGATGMGMLQCRPLRSGGSDVCVIAGDSIVIPSGHKVTATGSRPLVLMASGSIKVTGTLDVSSHLGMAQGPGANAAGCNAGTNALMAGGGQGGSFGTAGGNGGDQNLAPASHGSAGLPLTPTTLRGGCAGADGGGTPSSGGAGGGAVLLLASSLTIDATGVIDASGAAGLGALINRHGGGGGGSGGMIALASSSVSLAVGGQLFANGAGGGAGSGVFMQGQAGSEPIAAKPGCKGGSGYDTAGDGGRGYPDAADAQGGFGNGDGGGGGGGGGGVIHVYGTTLPDLTNVSPAPT